MSLTRNGFQSFVNTNNPPGVVGAFTSMNPHTTVVAGPNAPKAASGVNSQGVSASLSPIVGNFAWFNPANGLVYSEKPSGVTTFGFVANEGQTIIVDFLGQSRLAIQGGFPVTLFTRGDFWTTPRAPTSGNVTVGDTVYANPEDGSVTDDTTHFSATGVQTGSTTTVTVSAVTKGKLLVGDVLTGTNVDTGLTVLAQLTGSPGAAGTYTVSTNTGFTSTTITAANVNTGFVFLTGYAADASSTACTVAANTGVLTTSGASATPIEVGMNVTMTGLPNNVFVQAQLTGNTGEGGGATYLLNYQGPAVTSATATFSQAKMVKIGRTL